MRYTCTVWRRHTRCHTRKPYRLLSQRTRFVIIIRVVGLDQTLHTTSKLILPVSQTFWLFDSENPLAALTHTQKLPEIYLNLYFKIQKQNKMPKKSEQRAKFRFANSRTITALGKNFNFPTENKMENWKQYFRARCFFPLFPTPLHEFDGYVGAKFICEKLFSFLFFFSWKEFNWLKFKLRENEFCFAIAMSACLNRTHMCAFNTIQLKHIAIFIIQLIQMNWGIPLPTCISLQLIGSKYLKLTGRTLMHRIHMPKRIEWALSIIISFRQQTL